MKRLIAFSLLVSFCITLCACKPDLSDGELSSQPTEIPGPAIEVLAPVDIYEGNAPEGSNVILTVRDGYKLIQDMNSDDYPYKRYYDHISGSWWCIDIVPILQETDLQNRTMSYTAKTNYCGFFKGAANEYLGKETTHDTFVRWLGEHSMPEGEKDTEKPEHIWVDILIKADDKIVGFAVVEIVTMVLDGVTHEDGYMVDDRYTEYYPLIDGQFQEIDEEFVWQRIEQYHIYAST